MLLPVCRRSPFTTGGLRGGLTAHGRRGNQGRRGSRRPRPLASLPSFSHSVSSVSGNHRPHYRLALQLLRSNGAHETNLNNLVQKESSLFVVCFCLIWCSAHRKRPCFPSFLQLQSQISERQRRASLPLGASASEEQQCT